LRAYANQLFVLWRSAAAPHALGMNYDGGARSGLLVFDPCPFGQSPLLGAVITALYGDRTPVFRVDDHLPSDRWWKHVLLGPVPGEDGAPGELVQFLRREPDGMVLFDDALAHPGELLALFASARETGEIRASDGESLDVGATIFVVTAQVGREIQGDLESASGAEGAAFDEAFLRACARRWPDHLTSWTTLRFSWTILAHQRAELRLLPESRLPPPFHAELTALRIVQPQGPERTILPDAAQYDVFVSYKIARHRATAERMHAPRGPRARVEADPVPVAFRTSAARPRARAPRELVRRHRGPRAPRRGRRVHRTIRSPNAIRTAASRTLSNRRSEVTARAHAPNVGPAFRRPSSRSATRPRGFHSLSRRSRSATN
jgi:hypothetical protein